MHDMIIQHTILYYYVPMYCDVIQCNAPRVGSPSFVQRPQRISISDQSRMRLFHRCVSEGGEGVFLSPHYICMHVCMHVCVCMYIYIYIYVYVYM